MQQKATKYRLKKTPCEKIPASSNADLSKLHITWSLDKLTIYIYKNFFY